MSHSHTHHLPEGKVDDRTRRLLGALILPVVLGTVIGLVVLWPARADTAAELDAPDDLVDARIVTVEEVPCEGTLPESEVACAVATVRLLDGMEAGKEITLPGLPTDAGPDLDVGETLVLSYYSDAPPGFEYSFADVERRTPLYVLGALFAVAVVALGRVKGLRALAGIVVGLAVLTLFVLPAMLEGSNVVVVALVGASAVAISAIYLAHGLTAASTTALIGTFSALGVVAVLSYLFTEASRFSGLASEEATFLQISAEQLNVEGLILAGIMIGTLGVLDDVTVTQVSAVWELHRANPAYGFKDLYSAGVRIGRDHIASTVNTLVLAYAGASLPLLLLFTEAQQGLADVINGEAVAVEIVRTLVGSIGIVASVPITTALAALVVAGPAAGTESSDPRRHAARRERSFWSQP